MFDSKTTIASRLSDAADLLIDFATLGEYGLEPAEAISPSCQHRHRPQPSRSGAKPRGTNRGRGVGIRV